MRKMTKEELIEQLQTRKIRLYVKLDELLKVMGIALFTAMVFDNFELGGLHATFFLGGLLFCLSLQTFLRFYITELMKKDLKVIVEIKKIEGNYEK
jgi:hypothetical protein